MNKTSISIGLLNPKSPQNVGSVKRAAANYGVQSIFYTGSRYQRALTRNPDTPNTSRSIGDNIPVNGVNCLLENIPQNAKIICVEFAENAIALPEFTHPENAYYIFGPEDGNLSQSIINKADAVVYVPTNGCMNLAASVNVLLYDRMAKNYQVIEGNEIIRQSRDQNNNLKAKIGV